MALEINQFEKVVAQPRERENLKPIRKHPKQLNWLKCSETLDLVCICDLLKTSVVHANTRVTHALYHRHKLAYSVWRYFHQDCTFAFTQ